MNPNITYPPFLINSCLEFAKSLNKTFSPNVTFKTAKTGTEFIFIGGTKHYPILVNENLYKFLQTLWFFGTIVLICAVILLVVALLLSLGEAIVKHCKPVRPARASSPIPLTVPPGTQIQGAPPSYSESVRIYRDRHPPLIRRYLGQPVTTKDSKYILLAFQPILDSQPTATGVYIEVTPQGFCRTFDCDEPNCVRRHRFYIYVPCASNEHRQIELV